LNIKWEAGGNAIGVKLIGSQAFWLEKYLVRFLICKAMDFILDRWAIARTNAFDDAGVHRAAVEPATDDFMSLRVGMGYPAWKLAGMHGRIAPYRENGHGIKVAGLFGQPGEIYAAAINSRRRACFEPALWQLQFFETSGKRNRWRIPGAAGRVIIKADVDFAVQERPGGKHDCPATKADANLGDCADDIVAFNHEVIYSLLEQPKIWLVFQARTYRLLVEQAVGLSASRAYGWPFRRVENAELYSRFIRRYCHGPAHRVDLLNQMTFPYSAYGWVAGHLAKGFDIVGKQQGFLTHSRRSQSGFGAGMAAANNYDIKFGRK
jgi:hypothetical protein